MNNTLQFIVKHLLFCSLKQRAVRSCAKHASGLIVQADKVKTDFMLTLKASLLEH